MNVIGLAKPVVLAGDGLFPTTLSQEKYQDSIFREFHSRGNGRKRVNYYWEKIEFPNLSSGRQWNTHRILNSSLDQDIASKINKKYFLTDLKRS
jgi:hypothetical protein